MAGSTFPSQLGFPVINNTIISRFSQKALGAALGAVVAGLALTAGQAKAIVVSVRGLDYDVSTFTASFPDENPGKFQTEANGGNMPWWGNLALSL